MSVRGRACTGWPACSSAGSWALTRAGWTPPTCGPYVEEFTFPFNRRTSRSRGLVFRRPLQLLRWPRASPVSC